MQEYAGKTYYDFTEYYWDSFSPGHRTPHKDYRNMGCNYPSAMPPKVLAASDTGAAWSIEEHEHGWPAETLLKYGWRNPKLLVAAMNGLSSGLKTWELPFREFMKLTNHPKWVAN